MTSSHDDGFASEEEQEEIADAFIFAFGLAGPLDWVSELNQRLVAPAERLANARAAFDDPTRDSTDEIDAQAKAKIRIAATDYLSEIFRMLHAMPLFQQQPQILEALKFVITEIASVEKGRTLHWLQADPSKRHCTLSTKEAEWVPIILALELLCMLPDSSNPHAAATKISEKTGRPLGTIKRWHRKLYNGGKSGEIADFERPYAASEIRTEVQSIRLLRKAVDPASYKNLVEKRVQELLA